MAACRRDFDSYDRVCDHLLVIDHNLGPGPEGVVGTYRLIRRAAARAVGRFYSSDEYDIAPLVDFPGEVLELGRSCVDAGYRSRPSMQLLWRGIAAYVFQYDIEVMFGCASLPGTDPGRSGPAALLSAPPPSGSRRLAAAGRCRTATSTMSRLDKDQVDARAALGALPPLIKGYLRLGGFVGDGAVIDEQFNTTDVCIVVKTDLVTDKYFKHYERRRRRAGSRDDGLVTPRRRSAWRHMRPSPCR